MREKREKRDKYLLIFRGATLTLLGLIIGFSFSMAIGRYDQRRNFEEAEANAIGTEFVRAGFLPPSDTVRVRTLLKKYLDLRISFFQVTNRSEHSQIDARLATYVETSGNQ